MTLDWHRVTAMALPDLAGRPRSAPGSRSDLAEADSVERAVQPDVEPPVLAEEEQETERHQRETARDPDRRVVVPHPAESAHRPGEGDAREQEGDADAERVGEQQHRA